MDTFQTDWKPIQGGASTVLKFTCRENGSVQIESGECPDHNLASATYQNSDEALRQLSGILQEGQNSL